MKLAEALAPELPPDRAEAVLDEYLDLYNGFYLENMRKKLGLLKKDEPEDEIMITELLQTMHNTGAMGVGEHYILPSNILESIYIQYSIYMVQHELSHNYCNLFCPRPAGADFTNTFRSLSQISCPTEGENEGEEVKKASDLLLEQCASLEELKAANKPTMDPR